MRKADNLPPYRAVVMKSGSLNFLEPSGLHTRVAHSSVQSNILYKISAWKDLPAYDVFDSLVTCV